LQEKGLINNPQAAFEYLTEKAASQTREKEKQRRK